MFLKEILDIQNSYHVFSHPGQYFQLKFKNENIYAYIHIYTYMYILWDMHIYMGLPRWLSSKESICQCRRYSFYSWVRKIPLEEEMATHFSILAEKFHGQNSLEGYSLWGRKESDTTEQLSTYTHIWDPRH